MDIGWSEKGLAICNEFGLGWAKQCVRILFGNGQIVTTKSLINTTPFEPRGMRMAGFEQMLVSPAERDQNEMGGLQKRDRF